MKVNLKDGKTITLEWNALIFEYLEEYEGGLEQLKEDAKEGSNKSHYACNHMVYSVIAANLDEPVTYRQAIALVNLEDIKNILDFIINSSNKTLEKTSYNKHHK